MTTAIWWIRRDLRLGDNQALHAALVQSDVVFPVFILDPTLESSSYTSQDRLAFLYAGLRSLDSDLRKCGSHLVIRRGDPLEVLHNLRADTSAQAIYAEADISPYARQRDAEVMRELPLKLAPGVTIHPVETVRKADGAPYTVFTPFSRMWQSLPIPGKPLPLPGKLSTPPPIDKALSETRVQADGSLRGSTSPIFMPRKTFRPG